MPRPTDPTSTRQIKERARRMKEGAWTQQVLSNLAGAMLQAARWKAWEDSGGIPGPDDNRSSWPRLPDTPGERVELDITRLDLTTAEGWKTIRETSPDQWDRGQLWELAQTLAQQLAETLEHSPLLGPAFYDKHSRRAGDMLTTEEQTLPVTVLTGSYQSLWRTPKSPLGLPPIGHPLRPAEPETAEVAALNCVAWEAARDLYRSLGGSQPDEQGRRGLEQPRVLQLWCERLGLIEADGTMAVGPLTDEEVSRMATGLPWSKAQATMLSPKVAYQGSDEAPGHLHSSRQPMSPTSGGYEALVGVADHSSAESVDPLAWAHVQKAQELLETHGPEMARLSLYLSMHVCGRPDPTAPFLVEGEDMLRDFALDGTSGGRDRVAIVERSKKLRHQATLARALDLVTVQTKDYLGPADKNGSRPFRRFTGRLWSVESLEMGTETQLTLDGQTTIPADEVVTSLKLLIRPGSWVVKYPSQSTAKGQQLWYGHVATAVLRLSHERNQLAATLGLFLSTALYERQARQSGEARFKVQDLLSKVLVASDLEHAKTDRRYGERLRNRWVAALDLLHHRVGFRFAFCPDTYPAWAVPEVLRQTSQDVSGRAPHGALEQLLKGYITVRWPEPVLTLASSSKAEEHSRTLVAATAKPAQRKRPARGTPNGTLLKEGRKAARLNQKAAASVLGISPAQMCKLEGNQKTLSRNDLTRYLEKLAEAGRQARWDG
jgi:hypothetical protein